jgi:hypothetical protein
MAPSSWLVRARSRLEPRQVVRVGVGGPVLCLTRWLCVLGGSAGWSRMALRVTDLTILTVGKPRLGATTPSFVRADLSFSVGRLAEPLRREWDALRPHDVLFLVTLRPTAEGQAKHPDPARLDPAAFCEYYGVTAVRGCEITTILGPDGRPLDDYRDAAARRQSYGPRGQGSQREMGRGHVRCMDKG